MSKPRSLIGTSHRVTDAPGAGAVAGVQVPCSEVCIWVVVRCGAGLASVSRLKYSSRLCPYYRAHQQAAEESRRAAGGAS